ncbi:HNH endonuclease [Paenibacillus daejeonensis]|uniref:HNH endonuclease n=1 Tax=Paenibacillus daejeonensis TaxID=135193 RepID=UPI0003643C5F|nr:HNH endonuclease [Paenibacillus daejeonensis]
MSHDTQDQCALCGRHPLKTTVHHLIPKEKGGAGMPTADICSACHRQIHALYTNRDLVDRELTTVAALQADPEMARFLKWIAKQPLSVNPRVRKSERVKRHR